MHPKSLARGAAILLTASQAGSTAHFDNSVLEQRIASGHRWGVLVIDMQEKYMDLVSYEEKARELPNIIGTIEFAKEQDMPIYVIEFSPEINGSIIPQISDAVYDALNVHYLTKKSNDAFHDGELIELLRAEKIDSVYLMGVNASCCVLATAEGALYEGLRIAASIETMADGVLCKSLNPERRDWYVLNANVYSDSYIDALEQINLEIVSMIES